MKATSRESGGRDKKVVKLRQFLTDTSKSSSSFDLVNFHTQIPLIIDPNCKINGINVDKTTMFKSNLMPCKFVFRTATNESASENKNANTDSTSGSLNNVIQISEYATIYKIGDDLRQDQLVLQMIALMDKVWQFFLLVLVTFTFGSDR
jgi:phosphatidylinositol 3-kinase